MAAQDEREPGVVVMCSCLGPMAQDKSPEQDIVVEEQELPQMNPKPEMGAAAAEAAVYDTSPSLLRNPPPIPAETARPGAPDMAQLWAQLWAMLAAMSANMDANTQALINDARARRGETRQMGQCLQADKMATPRAATNELKGSAPAGEDRVIRETRRTRHEVTEERKLNGVTETCTVRRQVTELTETREVEERLHGVKGDEDTHTRTHTHRGSEGQWG